MLYNISQPSICCGNKAAANLRPKAVTNWNFEALLDLTRLILSQLLLLRVAWQLTAGSAWHWHWSGISNNQKDIHIPAAFSVVTDFTPEVLILFARAHDTHQLSSSYC